ncbi:MAG: ABC transporter permease [Steroidobacteraceae bacterium]
MRLPATLTRIFAIASKERRQMVRDRLTIGMIVMLPLVQIMIFGYGINFDVRQIRTGVVDFANTSASRALITDLEASQVVQVVARPAGAAQLQELITAGEVSAGVYIPPDFERRRISEDRPLAQLLVDGGKPGLEGALRALGSMPVPARKSVAPATPVTFEVLTLYNPERRTAVQVVPPLIGVILNMTMVLFTAIALVRERERGNLELLIMTPLKPVELMIGKLLPYVGVGLIQTTVVLSVGVLLFDVPVNGHLLDLYAGALLFISATLSLGLVISTLAATQFQAMQLAFFTLLPSILLSGFAFPFDGMPRTVQLIAQVLPLTHFVDIVRGVVLRGAGLDQLLGPVAKLGVVLAVSVSLAVLRFRKRLA